MTLAYLSQSEPVRQRWVVPDAALFSREGWVDSDSNLSVRQMTGADIASIFYAPADATVRACRIVADADNAGHHYIYVFFTYHYSTGDRNFLRQVKVDSGGGLITPFQQKEYTNFFLAGQPNNRKALDGAKVKDFSISANGRVLHIVYAESNAVWYDIYEYASADYSVGWIPENTNQIHAGVLNSDGNTFWKFSASNLAVVAALYNATLKTLQVRLFALTTGDHTNLTSAPQTTLEHTFTGVNSEPAGVLVSDDLTQAVLLGDGGYTLCNMSSVSGSAFSATRQTVLDRRFADMHIADWMPNNSVFWLSKSSARAMPYEVFFHDARIDLEAWIVGPGGNGSAERSGTAPDGQTIYIGGAGADGGEVLHIKITGLSPGTPMTVQVSSLETVLTVAGQTIRAKKGADGTANQGGEIARVTGGLGNRFGNPGKGCQGSINPIGTVGGRGQKLDLNPYDGTDDSIEYGRGGGGGGDGGGQSGSLGGQRGSNSNVRNGQDGQDGKGDGGGGARFNSPFGRGGRGGKGGVYALESRYIAGTTRNEATHETYQDKTMRVFLDNGQYLAGGSAGITTAAQLNAIRRPVVTTERLPPASYVVALLARTTHTLALPSTESNYSEFRGISIQGGKLYVLAKSSASTRRMFAYEFNLNSGANLGGSFSRKSNGLWSNSRPSNFMFGTSTKVGEFDPTTDRIRSYNLTTAGDISTLTRTGTNRRTVDDPGTTPAAGHDYVAMFIRDTNSQDPTGATRREGYILSTSSTQTIARRFWIANVSVSFSSWNSINGVLMTDFVLDDTKGGAVYIDIADDGKKALILFSDNVLHSYAMDTGWDFSGISQTGSASFPAGTQVSSACFHPDGKSVLVTDTAATRIAQFTI